MTDALRWKLRGREGGFQTLFVRYIYVPPIYTTTCRSVLCFLCVSMLLCPLGVLFFAVHSFTFVWRSKPTSAVVHSAQENFDALLKFVDLKLFLCSELVEETGKGLGTPPKIQKDIRGASRCIQHNSHACRQGVRPSGGGWVDAPRLGEHYHNRA